MTTKTKRQARKPQRGGKRPAAGRPATAKLQPFCVRLERKTMCSLKRIAVLDGKTIGATAYNCLKAFDYSNGISAKPIGNKTVDYTIKFNPVHLAVLRQRSEKMGVTTSEFLRAALRQALGA